VRAPAAALAAALVLQGCAAAFVQTNEPGADIYVDGRRIRPDGKVPHSVGPPHTARVLVIAKDGRRARATVSRRPWLGLAIAAYGFWPCVLVCWNYPSPTVVLLPPREATSSWDDAPGESAWDRAPGAAWAGEPTVTPTATATPTPASTPAVIPTSTPAPPPHHW
jgi:hypothetical protein